MALRPCLAGMISVPAALAATVALAGVSGFACRGREQAAPEVVARELAQQVALPAWRHVRERADALESAARALEAKADAGALARARDALAATLVALEAARPLRLGVGEERNLLLGAAYWPVRPTGIEALVSGSEPLDARSVAQGGAHLRGLFTVEYLLFPPDREAAATLEQLAASPRRRTYLALVVANATVALDSVGAQVEAAARTAPATINRAGFSALVNDLIDATESQVLRLAGAADPATGGSARARLPGDASGAVYAIPAAVLSSVRAAYAGSPSAPASARGLRALVAQRSPDLAARIDAALERAQTAVAAVASAGRGQRPSQAALRDAAQAARALEVVLKTELPPALNVARTFRSMDGD